MQNKLCTVLAIFSCFTISAQVKDIGPAKPNQIKSLAHPEFELNAGSARINKKTSLFSPVSLSPEIIDDGNGLPRIIYKDPDGGLLIRGRHSTLSVDSEQEDYVAYLKSLETLLTIDPSSELMVVNENTSYQMQHQRLQQVYKGIPVYQGELLVHKKDGQIGAVNGRIVAHKVQDVNPKFGTQIALEKALRCLASKTYFNRQNLNFGGIVLEDEIQLIIYRNPANHEDVRLTYRVVTFPNFMERWTVFIDAHSGEILKAYKSMCSLHNHVGEKCDHEHNEKPSSALQKEEVGNNLPGPETATARDLNGIFRNINVWRDGSTYYLIDGARPMFKSANDINNPDGVIWTVDARNTNPQSQNFQVYHVTSPNNTWIDPTSVSAHYNAAVAYEYFRQVHGRDSYNGRQSNLMSFIHVTDPMTNRSMDNAFWNGQFMFYGDGDQAFEPLAGAIDVAGHEMSHGVIQTTAALEYYGESGAINESFADVFGHLMDRDDWKIGEEVAKRSFFPSGTMRDMQNPNNGGTRLGIGWQPDHTRDQYQGTEDNGGVHINSGIPNHAFYLFVQKMANGISEEAARIKAEKIYYDVLENYLTKSSQFKDLRVAVIQATTAVYGASSSEVRAAQDAFSEVGIGQSSGGNYQKDLSINNGDQFLLFTNPQNSELDIRRLADNRDFVLTSSDILSRPSVTDDGSAIVFVDGQRTINVLIRQQDGSYEESNLQNDPIWRNVIVSKDGRRIAGVTTDQNNILEVYDFGRREWKQYQLYNPTTAQGVSTGDVLFSDAMDFDFSGEWIVYDAKNEVRQANGGTRSYWDVSFIRVWDENAGNFIQGQPRIEKLFSGLPEGTSIGNPTFSKNSDYIIGFDLIESDFFGTDYSVAAANIETGDFGIIWEQEELGWPNYSTDDQNLVFNGQSNGSEVLAIIDMNQDKINADPNSARVFIPNGRIGVWFANGERELTSTLDQIEGLTIQVSPQPAREYLKIEAQLTTALDGELLIYNALGAILHSQMIKWNEGSNNELINIENFPSSQLYMVVNSDQGTVMIPFLKL